MLLSQSRYAKRIRSAFNDNPTATNKQLATWIGCHESTAATYTRDLRATRSATTTKPVSPAAPAIPFRATVVPVALLGHRPAVRDTLLQGRPGEGRSASLPRMAFTPEVAAHPEVLAHELLSKARIAALCEGTDAARRAVLAAQSTVDAYAAFRTVLAAGARACSVSRRGEGVGRLVAALGTGASSEKLSAWTMRMGDHAYGASLSSRPDANPELRECRRDADDRYAKYLPARVVAAEADEAFQEACTNYASALGAALDAHLGAGEAFGYRASDRGRLLFRKNYTNSSERYNGPNRHTPTRGPRTPDERALWHLAGTMEMAAPRVIDTWTVRHTDLLADL